MAFNQIVYIKRLYAPEGNEKDKFLYAQFYIFNIDEPSIKYMKIQKCKNFDLT